MRLFLLSLAFGCASVSPVIHCDNFAACKKLCKRSGGAESIASNLSLGISGRYNVESETCSCKNKITFKITPSKEQRL